MNRGLPPEVLSPARADLFRGTFAERSTPTTLDDRRDLSLTVTIEDRSPSQRRFTFRAAREADSAVRPRPDREPDTGQVLLVTDQRRDSSTILNHADAHSSAPFLAGAIAQARPSPVLHNPPYREAAGAYDRSDGLGAAISRLGSHSDKRV